MKHLLPYVSFAVSAFVAGLICALFVAESLKENVWRETLSSFNSWKFDQQNAAALDLHNIEAAERGDVDTVIRANCYMLRSTLRGLDAEAFGAARQPEVRDFLEKARATVARLESQGLCSFPSHAKNN